MTLVVYSGVHADQHVSVCACYKIEMFGIHGWAPIFCILPTPTYCFQSVLLHCTEGSSNDLENHLKVHKMCLRNV